MDMSKVSKNLIYTVLKRSWKFLFAILIPIVLLPLIIYDPSSKSRCAYVLIIMASYWMIEPIPIAATALLPVALFPLLGVVGTSEACIPYMKSATMMFVGGLLMAIAIENSNLHKRVALWILMCVGSSIKRMMLGLMITTMFLSMWISNTATTAMMIPIVNAMLEEIFNQDNEKQVRRIEKENNNVITVDVGLEEANKNKMRFSNIRKILLLSVAYSANIGGTGTLTGTGTNLVLTGFFEKEYPTSTTLNFTSWFLYAAPGMVICIVASWFLLYTIFVRKFDKNKDNEKIIIKVIETKYKELGPLKFREILVMINFLVLIGLWFFREPIFIKGWARTLTDSVKIKDATPAILMSVIMFLMPDNLEQFYKENSTKKYKALLDWSSVNSKMPWGVILLLGGGFALADATDKSGLSKWFSDRLSLFHQHSPHQTMIILTIIAALVTEMASNAATASVILPVVNQLALGMKVHPLLLLMPVTIGVSFAFMFPVATPPNAIVFEALQLNTFDMIKPGILMNIICITIEIILINTWGLFVFDLNHFPDWALEAAGRNGTTVMG